MSFFRFGVHRHSWLKMLFVTTKHESHRKCQKKSLFFCSPEQNTQLNDKFWAWTLLVTGRVREKSLVRSRIQKGFQEIRSPGVSMVWQTLVPFVVFPLCLHFVRGLKKRRMYFWWVGIGKLHFSAVFFGLNEKNTHVFLHQKMDANLWKGLHKFARWFFGGNVSGGVRHIIRGAVLGVGHPARFRAPGCLEGQLGNWKASNISLWGCYFTRALLKATPPWLPPPRNKALLRNDKPPSPEKSFTSWWFQRCFIFTPIWGRFPFWRAYFSEGLKPPTSLVYMAHLGW